MTESYDTRIAKRALAMGMLTFIGMHFFVELETTSTPDEWRLSITKRIGGYQSTSWRGTLNEVLLAAHAFAQQALG